MKIFTYILSFAAAFLLTNSYALAGNEIYDLNLKLEKLDDQGTWAVYVVPGQSISPSKKAVTGTGQVTIVAPIDFEYIAFENHSGTWVQNSRVDGPMEAPENCYISFGFVADEPRIRYKTGEKTLLFTFKAIDSSIDVSIIDNESDPFLEPNTFGSNPGNDMGVIDFDTNGAMIAYHFGTIIDHQDHDKEASSLADEKSSPQSSTEYKAILASKKIEATRQ